MKVSTLLCCGSILSKRFIVRTSDNMENLMTSLSQTVEEITVGSLNFVVVERETFPIGLYNYDFVENIEEDLIVTINSQELQRSNGQTPLLIEPFKSYYLQNKPTWGLDRIDQKSNTLNEKYYYPVTMGVGVDVYIIDTGVEVDHKEFSGRVRWGGNFAGDGKDTDCNGHGTHVAGTIGSNTFGISKRSNLIAVKVLNCEGSGSYSGILRGFEFIINERKRSKNPAVSNMSLGGPKSDSINRAVEELVKSGVSTVVAAGNENQDACNVSPASSDKAITVGATSITNEFAWFSNHGVCVNILAPGVDIMSTYLKGTSKVLSGTSMASPHVAGVVALILSENVDLTPSGVKKFLEARCTENVITKVKSGTVNCLLYSIF